MRIRGKLTLALVACILVAVASTTAWFLSVVRQGIETAEREKARLILDHAVLVGQEAALAKDPLMLLQYLASVKAGREEVLHCQARVGGRWTEVGKSPDAAALAREEAEERDVAEGLRARVWFRSDVLRRRTEQAYRVSLARAAWFAASAAALGLLLSFAIGRSLSRRIEEIGEAMQRTGEGRLGAVVDARGHDEVAALALGFNEMSKRLAELDETKKTFVASVTHELRSPLGAIRALVRERLAQPALDEATRGTLERVRTAAERLEHFVTNLLQSAKIERGKLEFQPKRADLREVAEEVYLFFRPRAREAGLELLFEAPEGRLETRFDPDLIAQVYTNFVSNALKFTHAPGRVTVGAAKDGESLVGYVADTGVGIDSADLARLFKPFERIANPIKASGTGLGLSICKSIVEAHRGQVRANSEKGKGSRFEFHLPA